VNTNLSIKACKRDPTGNVWASLRNNKADRQEKPKENFDSSCRIFCKIENQMWSPEPTIKNGVLPKDQISRENKFLLK